METITIAYQRTQPRGNQDQSHSPETLHPTEHQLTFHRSGVLAKGNHFNKLTRLLKEFNYKHADYLKAIGQAEPQSFTLMGFIESLFSSDYHAVATYEASFHQSARALLERLTQIAKEEAKKKGSHQDQAYLKDIAHYVDARLTEIPWYFSITKEMYLLVALKESPSAFLRAQKDKDLERYVEELNAAKREFTAAPIATQSVDNRFSQYMFKVQGLEARFNTMGRQCLLEISRIEAARKKRGGFVNFFRDWFSSEKTRLQQLKDRKDIVEVFSASIALTKAIEIVHAIGEQLVQGTSSLKETDSDALRKAIFELTHSQNIEHRGIATKFIQKLQIKMTESIGRLAQLDANEITHLSNQLKFLGLDGHHQAAIIFSGIKRNLADQVRNTLAQLNGNDAAVGLAYIAKWEQFDTAILKAFDVKLVQDIADKRLQFESIIQLEANWVRLLDDAQAGELSSSERDQFIAAVLRLDQSSTALINTKLEDLQKQIVEGIDALSNGSTMSEAQINALRIRLSFAAAANAHYTQSLKHFRKEILKKLKDVLAKTRNVEETRNFLGRLASALPEDLANDPIIKAAVLDTKTALVKAHYTRAQRELFDQYQKEVEFLKTGKLTLWQEIKSNLTGDNPKALSVENIKKWSETFNSELTNQLTTAADLAVDYARLLGSAEQEEKKVTLRTYLEDQIVKDMGDVSRCAQADLMASSDMRRLRALEKLDKIFHQKATKPVGPEFFMVRYLAIADYQKKYQHHETLGASGAEFIADFHEAAQKNPGFVSQIIAKLPKDALDAMWESWKNDPEIAFSLEHNQPLGLQADIIGAVGADQNTHVQVPRHLLLRMVLELIIADFDALLRGKEIDRKLLNDRIAFVTPKLEQQLELEDSINQNQKVRTALRHLIQVITPEAVHAQYQQLICHALPKKATARKSRFFIDQSESRLLDHIREKLRDELEILESLNKEDLDCAAEEAALRNLEEVLGSMIVQQANIESTPSLGEEDREILAILKETIANHEAQKAEYEKKLALKQAQLKLKSAQLLNEQLKWSNHIREGMDVAKAMVNETGGSLKSFISKINPNLFDLLDPQLANCCKALRQNIEFSKLQEEEEFQQARQQWLSDLSNPKKPLLDTIRELPENIIEQLPGKTGDMIQQLQYRFTDHFKKIMVKLLDDNHLRSVESAVTSAHVSEPATSSQRVNTFGDSAAAKAMESVRLFGADQKRKATKKLEDVRKVAARGLPKYESCLAHIPGGAKLKAFILRGQDGRILGQIPVHERLAKVFESVDSEGSIAIKQMLAMLAHTADENDVSIEAVLKLAGAKGVIQTTVAADAEFDFEAYIEPRVDAEVGTGVRLVH